MLTTELLTCVFARMEGSGGRVTGVRVLSRLQSSGPDGGGGTGLSDTGDPPAASGGAGCRMRKPARGG